MRIESLGIADAWLCTPTQHADDRGVFLEWFRADRLEEATGRPFIPVQANHSRSRRGVIRGIHVVDVPPGQAKYVYCTRGQVLDVVVDLRVGSPTFGRHATAVLDDTDRRGAFVSEGLGHGFVALSDTADVAYLVSTGYDPSTEHGIDPLDPDLSLPWGVADPVLSDKDRSAPRLAEARARDLLPSYDDCRAWYDGLRGRPVR